MDTACTARVHLPIPGALPPAARHWLPSIMALVPLQGLSLAEKRCLTHPVTLLKEEQSLALSPPFKIAGKGRPSFRDSPGIS